MESRRSTWLLPTDVRAQNTSREKRSGEHADAFSQQMHRTATGFSTLATVETRIAFERLQQRYVCGSEDVALPCQVFHDENRIYLISYDLLFTPG